QGAVVGVREGEEAGAGRGELLCGAVVRGGGAVRCGCPRWGCCAAEWYGCLRLWSVDAVALGVLAGVEAVEHDAEDACRDRQGQGGGAQDAAAGLAEEEA